MAAKDFKRMMERAGSVDSTPFWVTPTVLRRAAELNAQIEGQLAIRAALALPFAKSLARIGFVRSGEKVPSAASSR
ncbi:MAG TPA: hypothetical protein VGB42_00465 [Candidatus Thermoplasmatota archaeon]